MANDDKLWFELGVRDNVSAKLSSLMMKAESLKSILKFVSTERGLYDNAVKVEQAYDKIGIALQRIKDARAKTTDTKELKALDDMEAKLREMRKEWKHLANSQREMATKGQASLLALKQNFSLAIEQVTRLANRIDKSSDLEVQSMDKLKRKYYEVSNLRKQLGDRITNAAPGVDTSAAQSLYYQLFSREGGIARAMKRGGSMPSNVQGADFDELIRKARELAKVLGVETKDAYDTAAKSARDLALSQQGLVTAYDKVVNSGKNANNVLHQLGMQVLSAFSLYAVERFLKNIITVGGEFEVQHVALQNILGDIQQANTLFAQLKSLAVESPFSFKQEVTYAKQLSAFNIPYKEIFDTTKRLGDLSAGLGIDMNRLILAYGQVRSAAVLRGQELRQFTEAGIPMVQALADEFSKLNGKVVTTGEVFSLISKRAVPFEMVKKVLWDMTNEGGRFYNMQMTLADTLAGKWSNLRDAWEIMLSDFAKGESVGGNTLKAFVQLTTDIIKNLNAMSPLIYGILTGLGATKALRFGENLFTLGFNKINKNIIEAQRLNAIEIQRKYTLGEIDLKRRDELLLQNASIKNAYAQLAVSGKLSAAQMQRAFQEGLIEKEYVEQARMLGIINQEEYAAIISGNRRLLVQERIRNAMNIGWTGWIGAAIMAGTFIWQAYSQWTSKIEQQVNAVVEGAKNKAKELGEIIGRYESQGTPDDREELRSRVNQMKQVLENSDAYTATIDEQVRRAKTLSDQYDVLIKAMKEAKEHSDFTANNKKNIEEAIKASKTFFGSKGGSLSSMPLFIDVAGNIKQFWDLMFNESIDTNLSQYDERLQAYESQKKAISSYRDEYVKAINDMKAESKGFADMIKGLSPEDALVKIANSEYWGEFQKRMGDSSDGFSKMVKKLNKDSDKMIKHLDEIKTDDLPKIRDEIFRQLGIDEKEYKAHTEKYESYTRNMITGIVASLEKGSTQARGQLAKALLEFFGLAAEGAQGVVKDAAYKPYRDQTSQGRNVLRTLINGAKAKGWGDKNGNGIWDVKWINKYFGDGVGYVEGLNAMKNKWNELKEEREAAVRSGARLSAMDEAEWNRLNKAASVYGFKDKASKIFGKDESSKTDKELKDWKERISLLEKYHKELEDLSKLMTRSDAEAKLRKDNNFNSLWEYFSNPNDYKSSINHAIDKLGTKGGRASYIDELNAKIGSKEINDYKKEVSDTVSELQRMLGVMSENYQTYKKWVELTGDTELAARVAGVTQNTSYADLLKEQMKNQLNKTNYALSAADVFGLNEKDAKKLGENSIIYKLWEAWQDNNKKLRKEQWDLYEEAYKGAKNYDDKIDDVNRKLVKQVEAIEKLAKTEKERDYLSKNAAKNANEQIGKLKWEKFKQENNWGEIFGDIENISLPRLKKLIKAMQELRTTSTLKLTEARAWQQGMNKAVEVMSKGDSVGSLKTAITNYTDAKTALDELRKNENLIGKGGKWANRNEYEEDIREAEIEVSSAINVLKKALSAFAKDLNSLASSFDSIGSNIGGTIGDILGGISSIFGGVGKSIEAISNINVNATGLSGVVNKLSAVTTVFSAMVEMNKKLDSILPSSEARYEYYAEQAREVNKLREAIDEYRLAVVKASAAESEWFAGNSLSKLKASGDEAKETLSAYYKEMYEAQEAYRDKGSGLKKWALPIAAGIATIVAGVLTAGAGSAASFAILGSAITGGLATGAVATAVGGMILAGVGTAVGQIAQSAIQGITYKDGQTDARSNMRIQTRHSSFWRSEKTQNLEEWVKENLNAELFDDEGLVNLEAAQQVLDKYGDKLVGDTKETLERLVELRKEYDEFIKQIEDYVSQIGTSLADNMTDSIWDWLSEGEDALDKFKEYASDTWRSIAQDIVKTFMKVTVLDKYADAFKEMFKAWSLGGLSDESLISGVAGLSGVIAEDFEKTLPMAEKIAQVLDQAFAQYGYDIKNSNSKSSSASNTIKGISENTADLLASYLNAIRLDVSVNRFTLSEILMAVQAQKDMPVVARAQLAQLQLIANNTLATANNTARIGEIYDLLRANTLGGNKFTIQ